MSSPIERLDRRIRLGMVGGGADSVIGETHRLAFRLDGLYELVAGAMSIDPQIAVASARAELIDPDRTYTDFNAMAEREAQRADGIDAVVIATPPQTHFDIATAFIERGIHVICEKPMTRTLTEARRLVDAVDAHDRRFALTHCYTGYPLVRQARAMVRAGELGRITLIEAEFASGDPGVALEPVDPAERHWRFRPESMGPAAILGEVGSHAHNIAEFVTGERAARVSARLDTFAQRREVYDNAYLTVEYEGGAIGRIWSSYVAIGNEHGLSFRIFGDDGALEWRQESPEVLWHRPLDGPPVGLTRGREGLRPDSLQATRMRPGHPEGYVLAFATLYREFAQAIVDGPSAAALLPTVHDGLATLALLDAAERSHLNGGAYQDVTSAPDAAADRV
jgi:predicted dehydrogenase